MMIIACERCAKKYSVPDERAADRAFKFRCKTCGYTIIVDHTNGLAGMGSNEAIWYVVLDGEQSGPLSAQEVEAYLYSGHIDAETYVWREGLGDDWVPLNTVPDFAHLVGAAAAGGGGDPFGAVMGDEGQRYEATRQVSAEEVFGHEQAFEEEDPVASLDEAGEYEGATKVVSMSDLGQFEDDPFGAGDDDDQGDVLAAGGAAAQPQAAIASAPAAQQDDDDDLDLASLTSMSSGGASGGASAAGGAAEPAGSPRRSANELVGARSENSVLFSLNNLRAIGTSTSSEPKNDLPTTEGSGLIDIKALASANASSPADGRQSFDADADAFDNAAVAVPTMMPMGNRKSNTALYVGIGLVALLLIGLIVVVIVFMGDKEATNAGPQVATMQQPAAPANDPEDEGTPDPGQSGPVEADGGPAGPAVAGVDSAPGDGAAPTADGAAPDGAAPDGAAPDGAAPDGAAPDGAAPDGEADGTGDQTAAVNSDDDDDDDDGSSRDGSSSRRDGSSRDGSSSRRDGSSRGDGSSPTPTPSNDDGSGDDSANSDDSGGDGGTTSSGGGGRQLTRSDIQNTIRANFSKIKTCMSAADVKGKLKISWKIRQDGRTRSVSIESPEFRGSRVGACVERVVEGMRFPRHDGDDAAVTYPFTIQ